jgi:hypothetical protein
MYNIRGYFPEKEEEAKIFIITADILYDVDDSSKICF